MINNKRIRMKAKNIYPVSWTEIHPYRQIQSSDAYYVDLANGLFDKLPEALFPAPVRKKISLHMAAYLEDLVSGLGLWEGFSRKCRSLYGYPLPFYAPGPDYLAGEVNEEDIRFLLWDAWQKMPVPHPYLNPFNETLREVAAQLHSVLATAYAEAPETPALRGCLDNFAGKEEAEEKLDWLFRRSYLTAPSLWPYDEHSISEYRFAMPTGPLALFLHEWIDLLAPASSCWQSVHKLYPAGHVIPEEVKERNATNDKLFREATGGSPILYLNGYGALKRFLTEALHWPDDENHTLPQMAGFRNFVLMANPERGILLAKDICESIADPANPMYRSDIASKQAFRLLTEQTLCPPDLLTYCISHRLLPDVRYPDGKEGERIQPDLDFIARHALLYYYRGD